MVARNVEVLKGRPMTARTKEIIDKREKIIENRYEPPLRHFVPSILRRGKKAPIEGSCRQSRLRGGKKRKSRGRHLDVSMVVDKVGATIGRPQC